MNSAAYRRLHPLRNGDPRKWFVGWDDVTRTWAAWPPMRGSGAQPQPFYFLTFEQALHYAMTVASSYIERNEP